MENWICCPVNDCVLHVPLFLYARHRISISIHTNWIICDCWYKHFHVVLYTRFLLFCTCTKSDQRCFLLNVYVCVCVCVCVSVFWVIGLEAAKTNAEISTFLYRAVEALLLVNDTGRIVACIIYKWFSKKKTA